MTHLKVMRRDDYNQKSLIDELVFCTLESSNSDSYLLKIHIEHNWKCNPHLLNRHYSKKTRCRTLWFERIRESDFSSRDYSG